MMARPFSKESELGPLVVGWLEGHGHEVYQEVDYGYIADVVGIRGPLITVVELKLSLSWELLSQAIRWRAHAHQVWVAVPRGKDSDGRTMAVRCFDQYGIGVLEVQPHWGPLSVIERGQAAFNRRLVDNRLRDALRPENRTMARAGATAGERNWTPFALTCARVRDYLTEHPGASVRDVIRDVQHHYGTDASARYHLMDCIKRGAVKGVRLESNGGTACLYLVVESQSTDQLKASEP